MFTNARTGLRFLGALALIATTGCNKDDKERSGIEIGALLSTSGDLSGIGTDMLRAANIAIAQINEAGGVLDGQELYITNEDDATDEGLADDAAEALVARGVPAFVGAVGSGFTIAASGVASSAGVAHISPSSTSPSITDLSDGGYTFRTCPSDALQGRLMAKRATESGYATAAVIYVPGAYGEGMAAEFQAAFEADGGTVVHNAAYTENQPSYVDLLTSVLALEPDVIAMPAYPVDGGQMIADYNAQFGSEDVAFLFADAVANEDFIAQAGSFDFDHEGTAPSFEGPSYQAFLTAWEAETGGPPTSPFLSNAYDATVLIALAIEAAGSTDGAAVRDALTEVSTGGTVYGADDLSGLLDAIRAGEDVDYNGTSGPVDFDANGDVVAPYDIWRVENGAVTTVEAAVNP